MYCTKCGTQINETAKFCQKCGAPVGNQPSQRVQAPVVQPAVPVNNTANASDSKIFHLISAGISATMLLCCFLPWVMADGKGYSLLTVFTKLTEIQDFEGFPFIFCSLIMLIGAGLLITSLILALKKDGMAKGFIIASAVAVGFTLLLFWFFDAGIKLVTGTIVPVMMLLMAVANIIIINIARKS